MGEWKATKLKNAPVAIIDGDRGKNYPPQSEFSSSGHCLFLSAKNVKKNGFDFSEKQFISEERDHALSKGKLRRNDIVLTTRGTVGNLAFYSEDVPYENVRINSGMVIVRPKTDEMKPEFCFYLFRALQQNQFEVFSSGSAQPQLPIRDMNEINLLIPDLPEQKAIAEVLSSLDDKIDLLHRQNKTLESLAQTLFRQWFIEEADDTWKPGTLSDVSSNIRKSVSVAGISDEVKYVALEHIEKRHIALYSCGEGKTVASNKSEFKRNDILFGKLRPYFHKVCFASFSGVCSTDILVIRPKAEIFFPFCLFAYFQDEVVDYSDLASEGTRMPRTNWEILGNYPIAIPDHETLTRFNRIALPNIQKIENNVAQIGSLTVLRDSLLPKLMSGEVSV